MPGSTKPADPLGFCAGKHEDTEFRTVSKNVYHGGKEDTETDSGDSQPQA